MKKLALVFVIAVLGPSLVLAWLALRSLRDQQFVIERQKTVLYQGVADSLAREAQAVLAEERREFAGHVETLLWQHESSHVTRSFDDQIRSNWPLAQVGFVVTLRGDLLCPSPHSRPEAQLFCSVNSSFLGNREAAEVYWNNFKSQSPGISNQSPPAQAQQKIASKAPAVRSVFPQQQSQAEAPAQSVSQQNFSKVAPTETEFRQLIGDSTDGMLARFLENKLHVLMWYRPPRSPNLIFGAQLDLARLTQKLEQLVQVEPALREEICVALLNDSAKPVARSHPNFNSNWKRPLVSTEIGEELPHWEVSVYLLQPDKFNQTAKTLKLTFSLLIGVLVLAIGVGGWLIVNDLNRQLTLARQKTDFVSNVSHELKTPLTSIRMFSELLAEGRVTEPAKQKSYLNIISAEASRLTRLINNVLDFSGMERGEKKYNFQKCDLRDVVRETCEMFQPHFEENGFRFSCEFPESPLLVNGDRDALAQIVVNLLSNAEKYSGETKEVVLTVCGSSKDLAEVKICDRGPGVSRGCEEKIFEQFFRAHDSLSSGVQGSGLGLTLARQIARAHGGDVVYAKRDGGGSCFALKIPLVTK